MGLKEIVKRIQLKKFKNLDREIIIEKINEFLRKNPKINERMKVNELNEKSSNFKKIIKYVKQSMHYSYGAFQNDIQKREKLLEELKNNFKDEIKNNGIKNNEMKLKILKTHSSTRERLDFYDKLKEDISKHIKNKSILDLGAGLNPLMFDENKIIAVEFNKKDADFLNEYFKIKNDKNNKNKNNKDDSNSKAIVLNLEKKESIERLKTIKTDIVFAWKLFDIINSKIAESIINIIKNNAEFLIASFSTKTLGKRHMNSPRRAGFQKMLRRLNLSYTTLSYENEMFYIIKNNKSIF